MTALIDADVIVYRAISPVTQEVDWDGEGVVPLHNLTAAKQIASDLVVKWAKLAGEKQLRLIFSDRTKEMASFRHIIHPHYKGNRPAAKPPMHDEIHDHLTERFPSLFWKDFEGDDVMGLMATDSPKYTMVTIDKDMKTLPGRLVNPMNPNPKPVQINLWQANYEWMFQTICGDSVDNFKGAPGAGPVKADEALRGATNFDALWQSAYAVFGEQFDKRGPRKKFVHDHPWDEFLMNARCARILRVGDWDPEAKLVRLWHPVDAEAEWINPYYEVKNDDADVHETANDGSRTVATDSGR